MKVVIMGCGRVGAQLASLLDAEGHQVTVLDRDAYSFRRLPPTFNGTALVGNGIDEAVPVIDTCVKTNSNSSLVQLLQVIRLASLKDRIGALREITPDLQMTCRRDGVWSYYLGSLLAPGIVKFTSRRAVV